MMAKLWIERNQVYAQLKSFFSDNGPDIQQFGNTVNQTFEAFVFASLVNWYKDRGWNVEFIHPKSGSNHVKLKFSTRGKPSSYTYALCRKRRQAVQIRHGLRVATRYNRVGLKYPANVVLDVAVISSIDLSNYKTDDYVDNGYLVTFGEAKHMSAFAELIASFIGLVHEIMPDSVKLIELCEEARVEREHPAPFLYVSGCLYPTAQGIVETIRDRGLDVVICDYEIGPQMFGLKLPVRRVSRPRKSKRQVRATGNRRVV